MGVIIYNQLSARLSICHVHGWNIVDLLVRLLKWSQAGKISSRARHSVNVFKNNISLSSYALYGQ